MESKKPAGIQLDLVLSYKAAYSCYLGNACDRFKLIADVPVLQRAQIGQAEVVRFVEQGILIDPTCAGRVGTQDWMDVRRQLALKLLQVFEHTAARPIQIRPVLEYYVHIGIVEHALCPNRFHASRREHRGDYRIGNLVLDYLGRLPFSFSMDNNLHVRNVRKSVERNML